MQHDIEPKITIKRIALKEITLFFSSPVAYLFLATFVALTLFIFFWGESFFARNIADVRPLFEWMPVLLIFLSATLTMRLWSEERRSGTLEYVLTQAPPLWHFVLGKFLACLFLLFIALAITLPLPITVAIIGDVDWGPVLAGYLATFLMGAAYLSMGLFVSARSDNQIVSLLSAVALGGLFYIIGSPIITELLSNTVAGWLRLLGTGSRFESITRGVLDLGDLYYYISIVLVFLTLNTFVLEKERWISQGDRPHHRQWQVVSALLIANAIVGNFWLDQMDRLRVDVTRGNQYSISDATRNYLDQLQEPLLVRGYFSSKTHPLLAPLVPQMRDLIKEYEVAGRGKVRVEFVDPLKDPESEKEANQKYGIKPVPFQVADRYQSSIVSSYFNVLVQYGDEYEVLSFRDLVEVQARSESDIDVQLRNPEHDLTRSIKKVLKTYQTAGNLFDTIKNKLILNAYLSSNDKLPEKLVEFRKAVEKVSGEIEQQSSGRFEVKIQNPDAENSKLGHQIAQDFGFQPMVTGLLSNKSFYFYLTLSLEQGSKDDPIVQIPLGDMNEDDFKRNLMAGVKRFSSGFTKTIALVTPKMEYAPYGGKQGARYSNLESFLSSDLNVKNEDLSDGEVSGEADILVLAGPEDLDEKQLFAVDQFLMKGGTVIAATSPYTASFSRKHLNLNKHRSGLEKWLQHYGLNIDDKVVMDLQNSAFPIPVMRNIGGLQIQDIRMLDYPYFIDVRDDGLNRDLPIISELPQVTMAWASPIQVEQDKQGSRKITELLHSSEDAWLSESRDIMPKVTANGIKPFIPDGKQASQLLAVVSEGRFDSYYAGKSSPLLETAEKKEKQSKEKTATGKEDDAEKYDKEDKKVPLQIGSVIEHSPESARIILFASNDFIRDQVIKMVSSAQRTRYLNTLQMVTNAVDWSLEDSGLLSIRSRGHFNRTLPPMEQSSQVFWEYLNYGLAILALVVIALVERRRRRLKQHRYLELYA